MRVRLSRVLIFKHEGSSCGPLCYLPERVTMHSRRPIIPGKRRCILMGNPGQCSNPLGGYYSPILKCKSHDTKNVWPCESELLHTTFTAPIRVTNPQAALPGGGGGGVADF